MGRHLLTAVVSHWTGGCTGVRGAGGTECCVLGDEQTEAHFVNMLGHMIVHRNVSVNL